MAHIKSPAAHVSPLTTPTCLRVPATGEATVVSIFIALNTTMGSPALNLLTGSDKDFDDGPGHRGADRARVEWIALLANDCAAAALGGAFENLSVVDLDDARNRVDFKEHFAVAARQQLTDSLKLDVRAHTAIGGDFDLFIDVQSLQERLGREQTDRPDGVALDDVLVEHLRVQSRRERILVRDRSTAGVLDGQFVL